MTPTDLTQAFHFLKYLIPGLCVVYVVSMAVLARKGLIR
jgi:hypothetical protein